MSRSNHLRVWSRFALGDLLAGSAGFAAAVWVYDALGEEIVFDLWLPERVPGITAAAVTFWLAMLHYPAEVERGFRAWSQKLLVTCGVILIVQAAAFDFFHFEPLPFAVILAGATALLVLLPLLRRWFFPPSAPPPAGILFVGFDRISEVLERSLGKSVLGFVHRDAAAAPADVTYLGEPARLAEVVAATRPARILVSGSGGRFPVPARLLLDLRLSGIAVEDELAVYRELFGRVCWKRMEPSALLLSESPATHRFVMSIQAVYTDLVGLALLTAAMPVLIAAAAAVLLLGGRGRVFERVACLGFQGIPFRMLRFRTRREDGGTPWIGRVLRRLHIVDLPQLINVVRGEMAFFGPPPVRKEFGIRMAQIIPCYALRSTVRPGMMGWSQLKLAGWKTVPDESLRLEYDLYYVQEVVPALDFEILIRSILPVPPPSTQPESFDAPGIA